LPAPGGAAQLRRDRVCRSFGLPSDRRIVLYLGSLDDRKNVMRLPELLRRLLAADLAPAPHLVVAGTGPLERSLGSELAVSDVSGHATMLGFVPDPTSLVAAADVVVLLSVAEGVPQVLVQAAASGTPFVAYAVDGVGELLELGADGVAVPLGDVGAAAAAVRSLLRRPPAHGVSLDLAPWSGEAIADGYRRVIDTVLDPRHGTAPAPGFPQHVMAGPA
jgi:glycosyltransferase involved in cell wall biosynthesis